jgi:hypothetical protein
MPGFDDDINKVLSNACPLVTVLAQVDLVADFLLFVV